MSSFPVDPIGLAKAILWEETKGKLRALVSAGGQSQSSGERTPKYEDVMKFVEKFIKSFEDNSYQE